MPLVAAVLLQTQSRTPRMEFLDNGQIRLGIDLNEGGAITFLSKEGGPNMVNDYDLGRQIQMSFYSGPVPFAPNGKQPMKSWAGLGWNPIQSGDSYGHPSQVVEFKKTRDSFFVKCIPMQWPLDKVPGECFFESSIKLVGSSAVVTGVLDNHRSDLTQFPARGQELPAIYTNGPWYRLITYSGDQPFENAPTNDEPTAFPWSTFHATEHWVALVDSSGSGLGVFDPSTVLFSGGFADKPGAGGPADFPTGYIAPNQIEILDSNIRYQFKYALVVGSIGDIRSYAYSHSPGEAPPNYVFRADRRHWRFEHCSDTGWPIRGKLHVLMTEDDPQLIGPDGFWNAEDAPTLTIVGAFKTHQTEAQVFFSRSDTPGFSEARSVHFPIIGDGKRRTYKVDLSNCPEYHGAITGLRLDPEPSGAAEDWAEIESIRLGR